MFAKGNDHVIAIMQNYIDNLPEILDKKIGHWFEPHETEQFQKRIALDQENMKQELAKYKIDRSYLEQSAWVHLTLAHEAIWHEINQKGGK